MRVTIIIGNYNYGRYLEATIESALAQTYVNTQVIVVDDGSTDNSREILARYTDRACVVLTENGGQPSSLMLAYGKCEGALVLFLDADDLLDPDAAEKAVSAWQGDMSKLQFPLRLIDSTGDEMGGTMPQAPLSEGLLDSVMLSTGRYVASPTSGNFWSRDLLDALFPVPQEWDHVDHYLNTLAPFYGRIGAIYQPLGSYRIHDNNMSGVADSVGIRVEKLQVLLEDSLRARSLLLRFAEKRKLKVSDGAVVSHWVHLKLELALAKLNGTGPPTKSLRKLTRALVRSVWASHRELSTAACLRISAWAVLVAAIPRRFSGYLIQIGFDQQLRLSWHSLFGRR